MAIEPFLGTRPQKAFLFTIIAQAIIVLAMVGITFGFIESNVDTNQEQYKTIPCYLALFALAEVFEVFIAIDALRLRNTIQLVGILLFHGSMIVMSGLQIPQTNESLVTDRDVSCDVNYANCSGDGSLFRFVLPFLVVVPVVLALSLVILVWVTRALFAEFGWAVFHAIGADPKMKSMYQYYQILLCLLKFDFFCFLGVSIQLLILVVARNATEFGLTIVAIPVVLILLSLCGLAVKREIRWIMLASLLLMVAAETYFVYKLIRFFEPSSRDTYRAIRGSLTVFTVVASLLLLLTFAVGVRCFADFGKGLKPSKLTDPEKARRGPKTPKGTPMGERGSAYMGAGPLQPRVSIE